MDSISAVTPLALYPDGEKWILDGFVEDSEIAKIAGSSVI